jgi:amicyanin
MRVILATLIACCALLGAPQDAGAASRSVTMAGYAFQPAALTIRAGDTVTWTNQDVAPHDVTTTGGPVAVHGATITKGQSWSYTFTVPGTYSYICSIHPDMRATLTVLPAVAATRAARPVTVTPSPRPRTVTRAAAARLPDTRRRVTRRPAPRTQATAASAAPVVSSTAGTPVATSGPPARPLRPLLIVAGIIAAVATLALLLLASRPEGSR